MNLCAVILLNSLALVSVCTSLNGREEEVLTNFSIKKNYVTFRNISRAKRGSDVMSLCSNVEFKSKEVPCSVNGNYELQKKIGAGGCGAVYMGYANIENRNVAIKIAEEIAEACITVKTEAQVYKDLFFQMLVPKKQLLEIYQQERLLVSHKFFGLARDGYGTKRPIIFL